MPETEIPVMKLITPAERLEMLDRHIQLATARRARLLRDFPELLNHGDEE